MSRADFYVLAGADEQARRLLACKLTEKAWRKGFTVYIRVATEREAAQMDDLLWTFRQGSFVPHGLTIHPAAAVPVWIGPAEAPPAGVVDLCINLASEALEPSRYERIAEIIDQDESRRSWGRERYRQYKEDGFQLETHKL